MQIHRIFGLAFVLGYVAFGCGCGSNEGPVGNGIDDPCPTRCGGNCADTSNDPDHCGVCDNACDGATPVCANGECVPSCPQGTLDCDDSCVDEMTDEQNCGGCGNDCPTGVECVGGACGDTGGGCRAGEVDCGDLCADLSSDPRHCGDCNEDCGAGGSCSSGVCDCVSGTVQCEDGCYDLSTSTTNCGNCGRECEGSGTCEAGICIDPGDVCENSREDCDPGAGVDCVDTDRDPNHCGECFVECGADELCNDGNCDPFYVPECDCFGNCPCEADFRCCEVDGTGNLCIESDECP